MNSSNKALSRNNKGRNGQGQTTQMEQEEEEDESSSSSSIAIPPIVSGVEKQPEIVEEEENVEGTLESFRQQWKKEVSSQNEKSDELIDESRNESTDNTFGKGKKEIPNQPAESDIEKKARDLFLKGVEHEQNGMLYEAILKYKKAVHLVPDIEFKVFNFLNEKNSNANLSISSSSFKGSDTLMKEETRPYDKEDFLDCDLLTKFRELSLENESFCQPEVFSEDVHISSLPMEVLINILKWVVSSDLDIQSLEACSKVCRGFYLASRSSDVWRLLCLHVWGIESTEALSSAVKNNLKNNEYNWRNYFVENPRVHLNGCYIAKISYMREGERGFQDHEMYKAWHVVQYYRLIRFFPGGKVVMTTTADEPAQAVKNFNNMQGTGIPESMIGRYQTVHDRVTCVVQKNTSNINKNNDPVLKYKRSNKSGKNVPYVFEVPDQVFHFEMQIKGKKFNQLHWLNYAVVSRYKSTGKSQQSEFNIKDIYVYPPLHFSRVKSYTYTEAIEPLS